MHIDLDDGVPPTLTTQICVVGAGAAGITLTRRLLAEGLDVILLESGGLDYEAATADLNAGENIGEDYYELDQARLRFFGGTTAIWGGRCAELDPIDLERRPWVPHSGWPISWEALSSHYAEARSLLDLPEQLPPPEDLERSGVPLPAFDSKRIRKALWIFDERHNRFAFDSCADLRDHPRCRIVTHATVREFVAGWGGSWIEHLDVRGRSGRRLEVVADHYVLAAGGIENPRLLLASRSAMPSGLGNGHDQVGRYFMEHPHARGGHIVSSDAWMLLKAFGRKHLVDQNMVAALVTPGLQLQAEAGLLNTSLTIAGRRPVHGAESYGMRVYNKLKHDTAPSRNARELWLQTKRIVNGALHYTEPARPWMLHKLGRLDVALVVRGEQAPNPQSRVTLSDEIDPAGVPRVRLDWRTSALDVDSVRGLVTALRTELRRLGLGETHPADWLNDNNARWTTDPLISAHPIGGFHHMGTTRMSEDPKHGVTDSEGRVHGIGNLFVAGSSLFPTSGWANPTLTIVALALRTAEAISREMTAASAWPMAKSEARMMSAAN